MTVASRRVQGEPVSKVTRRFIDSLTNLDHVELAGVLGIDFEEIEEKIYGRSPGGKPPGRKGRRRREAER
jgi:hypothetical protein